jgi:hypothetical protein
MTTRLECACALYKKLLRKFVIDCREACLWEGKKENGKDVFTKLTGEPEYFYIFSNFPFTNFAIDIYVFARWWIHKNRPARGEHNRHRT